MNPKLKTQNSQPVVNLLSIDVEDYFQVSAFETVCDPCTWEGRECRVEANTQRILGILAGADVRATFFVLGWVAERYPGLVKRIAAGGHEVASHGYGHRRVYHQSRAEFREDIRRSKTLLEGLTGEAVLGYRAPSYSISPACLWAFDELSEAGFVYDSSVFPIRHDLYGMPDWPRFPFVVEKLEGGNWAPRESGQRSAVSGQRDTGGGLAVAESRELKADGLPSLLEVPITTLRLMGKNLPIAGGGYFRLFPYGFTRWGLRRINRVDAQPFVFYLHPWEIDPGQPKMRGAGLKSSFRHYLNLARTESRLQCLLRDFAFAPISKVLQLPPSLPASPCLPRSVLLEYVKLV